jgi:hypothetical protein
LPQRKSEQNCRYGKAYGGERPPQKLTVVRKQTKCIAAIEDKGEVNGTRPFDSRANGDQ